MNALSARFDPLLLARTEEAGLNVTAVAQQRLFDGWLMRFSPGKAKRARSITALVPGRLPVEERLAVCEAAYQRAQLPIMLRMTPFSQPAGLDAQLEALGLHRVGLTRVMVHAQLDEIGGQGAAQGLSIERVGLDAFARVIGGMRGSSTSQQQAHADRLMHAPVPLEAWVARSHGQVLGCGHIAVDENLAGLFDVFVLPEARGKGLAQHLCRVLMQRGQVLGATAAYLQVEDDNLPAVAVYERLGFGLAYHYHYRTKAVDVV